MRNPSSPDFAVAISKQLTEELSAFGAKARIIVGPEFIEIEWDPTSKIDIVGAAVKLLQSGNYRSAVPLLQNVLATDPDNTVALFNLGMALSDQGQLIRCHRIPQATRTIAAGKFRRLDRCRYRGKSQQ